MSPHHPYEGSQRQRVRGAHVGERVLITPTRGRNPARRPATGSPSSPHHPYEGSQLEPVWITTTVTFRSSSPLRGVATYVLSPTRTRTTPVLITPTRGRNPFITLSMDPTTGSPHRPYEGSQRREAIARLELAAGEVLIAPTRGRNWSCVTWSVRRAGGPHCPYKGSQPDAADGGLRALLGSSSSLRGVATRGSRRGVRSIPASQSSLPLRGVATVPPPCGEIRLPWSSSPLQAVATSWSGAGEPSPRSSSPLRQVAALHFAFPMRRDRSPTSISAKSRQNWGSSALSDNDADEEFRSTELRSISNRAGLSMRRSCL